MKPARDRRISVALTQSEWEFISKLVLEAQEKNLKKYEFYANYDLLLYRILKGRFDVQKKIRNNIAKQRETKREGNCSRNRGGTHDTS